MTIKGLKETIKDLPDDMKVYILPPDLFDDPQERHEKAEARYAANDGRSVWFESYGQEEIGAEIEAFAEYAFTEADMSDADFVRELIDPDGYGYTWADLEYNLPQERYEWIRETAYNNGLI